DRTSRIRRADCRVPGLKCRNDRTIRDHFGRCCMKKEGIKRQREWLFRVFAAAVAVLTLSIGSVAEEGLTIRNDANQKWPSAEAHKVYLSACAAVQREFGISRELRPQITLILGASKQGVDLDQREIRLAKWDQFLFAEGVVW